MAAPVVVEFVFGLGSRYSYLASTQLEAIAARTGCRFEWVPVSSRALMAVRGRTPFAESPTSGQYEADYRRRDAGDWARLYGVPFVEPWPAPEDHALMAVATRAADGQGALVAYARAMFDAVFVRHARIDEDACVALARHLGLDEGTIRPHEHTRRETEDRVLEHLRAVRAHTDPVAMAHRADPALAALLQDVIETDATLSECLLPLLEARLVLYHRFRELDNRTRKLAQADPVCQRDRKSTRLNSSHMSESRMPSSA